MYNEYFRLSNLLGEFTQYLPSWMKMRKDPESVGAQFLNVFALEYEDIKKYLDEVSDNLRLATANEEHIDIVYRIYCDSDTPYVEAETFDGDIIELQGVSTIPDFYLSYNDIYILDIDKNVLYTRKEYKCIYLNMNYENPIVQEIHHVWNHFDEFGMVLGTQRLYGENNEEYKDRLLAVFRYPGNATKRGIINGASRLLGLLKTVIWEDDSKPFFIVSAGISYDKVWIDSKQLDPNACVSRKGIIKINKISDSSPGIRHKVQYIDRMLVNQLWDEEIRPLLYNPDGTATPRLKHIAANIQNEVPIMWDEFIWDEGYWDVIGEEMDEINYIPNIWDADIEAWRGVKIVK